MVAPADQANFLRGPLQTFQFSTDVSTEKQVFLLIGGGRAAEYERLLRLTCAAL